jgi:hypothetical protein
VREGLWKIAEMLAGRAGLFGGKADMVRVATNFSERRWREIARSPSCA